MKPSKQPSKFMRLTIFWSFIVVVGLVLWAVYSPQQNLKDVALSDVISRANSGEISKIQIEGNELTVTPKGSDKATEKSVKEEGSTIYEQGLQQGKTEVAVKKPSDTSNTLWNIASILLPVLLFGGFFYLMFRQAQGQSNQAMGFGRSKARLYGNEKDKIEKRRKWQR